MDWLSPVSGLIGGIVSEFAADKRAKINRDAQIAENQKNREWQEHMYNTYESPSAQKQQMLEAGLNPMGAVSPQSVGSASTSSLPTNSGAANSFGSAIQQAIPQFYEAALAKKQLRLADLEAEQQTLENWKQAFENGNAQELYDIQKEEIQSRSALTRQEQKLKAKELEMLDLTYNKAKEAYDAGINEFKDAHDLSLSHIAESQQSIKESEQRIKESEERISNMKIDKEYKNFIFETARLFDRQFLELDYAARQKEVQEFLDTSDARVSLYNVQIAFAKLAVDEASRQDALNTITNETQLIFAQRILDAAKDGKTSFDAVLLQGFTQDPVGFLGACTSLLGTFKPSITNNNSTYHQTISKKTYINN